jgi:phosphate transport system substrate-binding protein
VKTSHNATLLIIGLILILVAAGCGQPARGAVSKDELSGTITVSGAWALYPLMVRWSEEFQALHPGVQFDISAGGAGKGMADALANAVDIGMVSREIYPAEEEQGAFWVPVAKDAVFPTVSANNPVLSDLLAQGVSQPTFTGIFITGQVTTWGQVVGQAGETSPIHVFTRSDAAGAPATWADYLGGQQEDLLGIGVYGDPGLLETVIKDPLGIGFNNLNYIFDMETGQFLPGIRTIPVDVNGNGRADPEEGYTTKEEAVKAVGAGQYPSPPARDLNLVTRGEPAGLAKTFMIWVLTDGQKYVDEAGYVALPQAKLENALQKLD